MIIMRRSVVILFLLWCLSALGAEVIPPAPEHYFNDFAGVVDPNTSAQLNSRLDSFERQTGNQVVVAIYQRMQSDSSIDDYANRVFRAWKIGQKDKNNGVLLLIFIGNRQMFIETGYGLEGALPDATCKQITEYEIKPHFKAGDYSGGVAAGVNAIIDATQHEYKGNGTTVYSRSNGGDGQTFSLVPIVIVLIPIIFLILFARQGRKHGWVITSGGVGGFGGWGGSGWNSGSWGGGSWGGGGGGGGGFSGGGGFMGGGGSSGGGGAGSSW